MADVYDSPYPRSLDALGLDYYDPLAARHFRPPGHRTAGGRNRLPTRELWDDVPDPPGLTRWLQTQRSLAPGLPIWVVENGLCNRVRNGRAYARLDGWDRRRYLRENIAAVVAAIDDGVPVQGYWHWSLVDNYEWGSYEPRFGLYGVDRHHGEHGFRWLDTDSLGDDSAGHLPPDHRRPASRGPIGAEAGPGAMSRPPDPARRRASDPILSPTTSRPNPAEHLLGLDDDLGDEAGRRDQGLDGAHSLAGGVALAFRIDVRGVLAPSEVEGPVLHRFAELAGERAQLVRVAPRRTWCTRCAPPAWSCRRTPG